MQHIDGINLFGLISIVSLVYCVPAALLVERGAWSAAWAAASSQLGTAALLQLLALSGLFYHLYNQVWVAAGLAASLRRLLCSEVYLVPSSVYVLLILLLHVFTCMPLLQWP